MTRTKLDISTIDIPENITNLLLSLSRKNTEKRKKAHNTLLNYKRTALPFLIKSLSSKNKNLRWEAAKIISEFAFEETIPELIGLLNDEHTDIRWIAADGLIKIGRNSLVPLLKQLNINRDQIFLNAGAHKVLTELLNGEEKKEI
ncbi:MAG: HEAT repeat domain-containing protein [Bacteroidales bacterium]|nr:HEAT repeat domain-containing protein [Bacteroidales bacterium]